MSLSRTPLTPQSRAQSEEIWAQNLRKYKTVNFWTEPTVRELIDWLERFDFDLSKVHLSGYESGGLQVFLA